MKITEDQYREAETNYLGYCPDCDDLTRDMTEPDAEKYDCPQCEQKTVKGLMTALIEGDLEII